MPEDVVVSMGTGTSRPPNGTKKGFLIRLFQSFMVSLDGEKTWTSLYNQLPAQKASQFFRFNVHFEDSEPSLDDVCRMQDLGRTETSTPEARKVEQDLAEVLVAKQFYYELAQCPIFDKGKYWCVGYLCCRFRGQVQLALLNRLCQISAEFRVGDTLLTRLRRPVQLNHGLYRQKVEFCVNNMNQQITITLVGMLTKSTAISGFPTSVTDLIRNQGLEEVFGNDKHSKRIWQHIVHSSSEIPTKRRRLDVRM